MYTPYLNGNCVAEALSEGHIYMWMILLDAEEDLSIPIIMLWHRGDFSTSEWWSSSALMRAGLLWGKHQAARHRSSSEYARWCQDCSIFESGEEEGKRPGQLIDREPSNVKEFKGPRPTVLLCLSLSGSIFSAFGFWILVSTGQLRTVIHQRG